MPSVWQQNMQMPRFPELEGSCRTRTLIIGGGMAGVLCAHMLARVGEDYLLVEADRLGGGITQNTTAKITAQHGLIYDKLMCTAGEQTAGAYLQANQWAVEEYRSLCREIDCDFAEKDNFVYDLTDRQAVEREVAALQRLGAPAELRDSLPLPFPVAGAVCLHGQAQFHPLKFLAGISRELNIRENTKVRQLLPGKAVTDKGEIRAERIIVATHFPMLNKHGGYFLKLHQHRSYVLALQNAPDVDGMYVDGSKTGLSFRNYGELLLLGGGSHRTGKQGGGWQELEAFARKHYPQAVEAARWATQDCMTLDGVPYVGRYGRGTEGLYVATGFNKWGMTSAMAAAKVLQELVRGREHPWQQVFSPQRSVFHPQLAANAAQSAIGLLTPTGPRCPHMGCALKWNEQERTWDCPCHGSRFTEHGQLIDNPATDDKQI